MTNKRTDCILRLIVPLAVLSGMPLLSGCIGVLPIPVYSHTPEFGQKINRNQVAFIQVGKTTRPEVISNLGTNCYWSRRYQVLAYTWEMRGGGGCWWAYGTEGGTSGDWLGGWRGFLVAFDDKGVASASGFRRLSPQRSLDDNLNCWPARNKPQAN
jgi:hypothetical protein